jgi:hypothetical protein
MLKIRDMKLKVDADTSPGKSVLTSSGDCFTLLANIEKIIPSQKKLIEKMTSTSIIFFKVN